MPSLVWKAVSASRLTLAGPLLTTCLPASSATHYEPGIHRMYRAGLVSICMKWWLVLSCSELIVLHGFVWCGVVCYVMLCYGMLCYGMLCYGMLCYVMLSVLCYVMLRYVMLC